MRDLVRPDDVDDRMVIGVVFEPPLAHLKGPQVMFKVITLPTDNAHAFRRKFSIKRVERVIAYHSEWFVQLGPSRRQACRAACVAGEISQASSEWALFAFEQCLSAGEREIG